MQKTARRTIQNSSQGLSLIEVLVATAISGIVITGIMSQFTVANKTAKKLSLKNSVFSKEKSILMGIDCMMTLKIQQDGSNSACTSEPIPLISKRGSEIGTLVNNIKIPHEYSKAKIYGLEDNWYYHASCDDNGLDVKFAKISNGRFESDPLTGISLDFSGQHDLGNSKLQLCTGYFQKEKSIIKPSCPEASFYPNNLQKDKIRDCQKAKTVDLAFNQVMQASDEYSDDIANDAIVSRLISPTIVDSHSLKTSAFTEQYFVPGSLETKNIEPNTIRNTAGGHLLQNQSIQSNHFVNNAVTNAKLAMSSVHGNSTDGQFNHIKNGSLQGSDVANNAIRTANIRNGGINETDDIQDAALSTEKISEVQGVDIADEAISTNKIASSTLGNTQFRKNTSYSGIETQKIAAIERKDCTVGCVTTADLQSNSVKGQEFQNESITGRKIKDRSLTLRKISALGCDEGFVPVVKETTNGAKYWGCDQPDNVGGGSDSGNGIQFHVGSITYWVDANKFYANGGDSVVQIQGATTFNTPGLKQGSSIGSELASGGYGKVYLYPDQVYGARCAPGWTIVSCSESTPFTTFGKYLTIMPGERVKFDHDYFVSPQHNACLTTVVYSSMRSTHYQAKHEMQVVCARREANGG